MTNEFEDFAGNLQRDHTALQQGRDEAQEAARQDHNHRFEFARTYLDGHVLPILERAREAFEANGVCVLIDNNWGPDKYPIWPTLTFQVFGQKKRPHDPSSYEIGGDIASVTHDHEKLKVAMSPVGHNPYPGKSLIGEDLSFVAEGAKRALSSLYDVIKPPAI